MSSVVIMLGSLRVKTITVIILSVAIIRIFYSNHVSYLSLHGIVVEIQSDILFQHSSLVGKDVPKIIISNINSPGKNQ